MAAGRSNLGNNAVKSVIPTNEVRRLIANCFLEQLSGFSMRRFGYLSGHLPGALALLSLCLPTVVISAERGPGKSVSKWTSVSPPEMPSQSPDIAIGPDGSINIVWLGENSAPPNAEQIARRGHSHDSSTNLYFSRSIDGGQSFSSPLKINPGDGDVWGFAISKPRIAIGDDGVIHILYPGNAKNPTTGESETVALYVRSKDDRLTFDSARRLNVDAVTDGLIKDDGGSFATIAAGPNGLVYAAWIDTRTMTTGETARAALAVSTDSGNTFTPDFEILSSIVCPCCQLSSAIDTKGRLILGTRLVDGKFRDNEIVTFSRQGRHLESRRRIPGARWELEGCPRKPSALAIRKTNWAVAYYSGAENPDGVYTAWSKDAGKSWSIPKALHLDAKLSDAPSMVFAGNRLYVVWQARLDTGGYRLFASHSNDGGQNFTAPVPLPIPEGVGRLPSIAAHADGSIQIAWQHDRSVKTLRWNP